MFLERYVVETVTADFGLIVRTASKLMTWFVCRVSISVFRNAYIVKNETAIIKRTELKHLSQGLNDKCFPEVMSVSSYSIYSIAGGGSYV